MANLLVVDDDLDMVDASADGLRAEGRTVGIPSHGEQGRARLAEETPEVIICGELPVLTGPEMAYEIVPSEIGRGLVSVLLMSGIPWSSEGLSEEGRFLRLRRNCALREAGCGSTVALAALAVSDRSRAGPPGRCW